MRDVNCVPVAQVIINLSRYFPDAYSSADEGQTYEEMFPETDIYGDEGEGENEANQDDQKEFSPQDSRTMPPYSAFFIFSDTNKYVTRTANHIRHTCCTLICPFLQKMFVWDCFNQPSALCCNTLYLSRETVKTKYMTFRLNYSSRQNKLTILRTCLSTFSIKLDRKQIKGQKIPPKNACFDGY